MKCVSGKTVYETESMAEDALIDHWVRHGHAEDSGPQAIYRCEDCGRFHFTKRGPMNGKLAEALGDGTIARLRRAAGWEEKLRRK